MPLTLTIRCQEEDHRVVLQDDGSVKLCDHYDVDSEIALCALADLPELPCLHFCKWWTRDPVSALQHQILFHNAVLLAAICAKHVLFLFEQLRPRDRRPRVAIDAAIQGARYGPPGPSTAKVVFDAAKSARDAPNAIRIPDQDAGLPWLAATAAAAAASKAAEAAAGSGGWISIAAAVRSAQGAMHHAIAGGSDVERAWQQRMVVAFLSAETTDAALADHGVLLPEPPCP